MNRYSICSCESVVKFFLFKSVQFRFELVLRDQFDPGKEDGLTHLINHIAHTDWIGYGGGYLVCEIHLFSNTVHGLINLVDFATESLARDGHERWLH